MKKMLSSQECPRDGYFCLTFYFDIISQVRENRALDKRGSRILFHVLLQILIVRNQWPFSYN